MSPLRRRLKHLATIVLAAITMTFLAACGGDDPGRDRGDKTPKPPRTHATPKNPTTDPTATSPDPSESASPGASVPPSTSAPPAPPKPKVLKLKMLAGKLTGAPDRLKVSVGQPVEISIRSDIAGELHVHGIEQTLPLVVGERVTLEFVVPPAPGPGTYVVELHPGGQLVFGLEVS